MEGKDTNELYQIHFFKMYEGKLKNYQMGYSNVGEFDKASYKWVTDSIVAVTLINSITNERRSLKLAQHGDTAAILKESFEEKK
ncbi:MAG TPA: hypothetical protein VJY62_06250 [Bacteroidia bacterium]|nr:hypothetical protein [Bacteroidia bacterium]